MFRDRFAELHDLAAKAVGQNDFGDTEYHSGLGKVLDSLGAVESLEPGDRQEAEQILVMMLSSRLITQASWSTNPGWQAQSIAQPLIVLGVPRTGTTALHQLLSLDPQFQGIEYWLQAGPKARPPRDAWNDDPQYVAAVEAMKQAHLNAPNVTAAHSVSAEDKYECIMPMAQSFVSNLYPSMLTVPEYDSWFRRQDETGSYRRYASIMRLVGLGDERRWLLKNPSHLFGIDALLEVFPDACLIQTHRHPAKSLASLSSLLAGLRKMAGATSVTCERIQKREIDFWAEATRRGMSAQDKHPERFFNVWQHEIRAQPLEVVARIYDRFRLRLSGEAERRMRCWAADNPATAKSSHTYRPVKNEDYVSECFAAYIERYGL
jgi:hypothetical protein